MASFRTFQVAHGLFVCQAFACKKTVVDHHNAVACHQAHFLGRSAGNHAVYVYRVFLNGELDAYTAEAAFKFGINLLQFLCGDVGGVGVEFRQYLRHGLLYQIGHVDGIHILVINNTQQGIQLVGRAIDDSQFITGKMPGIKRSDKDSRDYADCDDERHKAGSIFCTHDVYLLLDYLQFTIWLRMQLSTFHFQLFIIH